MCWISTMGAPLTVGSASVSRFKQVKLDRESGLRIDGSVIVESFSSLNFLREYVLYLLQFLAFCELILMFCAYFMRNYLVYQVNHVICPPTHSLNDMWYNLIPQLNNHTTPRLKRQKYATRSSWTTHTGKPVEQHWTTESKSPATNKDQLTTTNKSSHVFIILNTLKFQIVLHIQFLKQNWGFQLLRSFPWLLLIFDIILMYLSCFFFYEQMR